MKKETMNYFDEFEKSVKYSYEIANILHEFVLNYNYENSPEMEEKVHHLENEGDRNHHKVMNYLLKDFVPPIDREDIINLSNKIDDSIDAIDEVVIDLNIFDVSVLRNDIKDFTSLLFTATSKLCELFSYFKGIKNYDEVKKLVVEINTIEEQGDKLYQNAIKNLYKTESRGIEISKWQKIYERLEDSFDAIEHVAECVDEIYMKNS